jgi:hypothetical protein
MKSYLTLLFSSIFLVIFSSFVFGVFTIRAGFCNSNEVCVFSMWNLTNSHVSMCSNYTNYTLCSDEMSSVTLRLNSCNPGESALLNFYQSNNTHVELINGTYTYKLCSSTPNQVCVLRSNCNPGESQVISMYNWTNSHVAEYNHYPNKLCCFNQTTAPTISNESVNTTSIKIGEAFRITATVNDVGFVSSVIVTIKYPNGTSANFTMSILSGNIYFYDFSDTYQVGNYVWTDTYANNSVGNWAHTNPNIQVTTKGPVCIEGRASDYFTGLPISNGTVTAIVKENGDRGFTTTNFDGSFNFCFYTSINPNKNSFTVGLIANSTDGKIGWNSFILGKGPRVEQTQVCSFRQIHFSGKAISPYGIIDKGNVLVKVNSEKGIFTNSTNFTNGIWDIYISPCLISGGLYTFDFIISSEDKISTLTIQQIAW